MCTVFNELWIALMKWLPTISAFAAGTSPETGNETVSKILGWVAGIGGGIVAIVLVISLVKDALGLIKGQGDSSVVKVVGKALFLILIIGLIFLATNYTALGNTANGIAGKGINAVGNEVNKAL
jgi:predicted small secreted protein